MALKARRPWVAALNRGTQSYQIRVTSCSWRAFLLSHLHFSAIIHFPIALVWSGVDTFKLLPFFSPSPHSLGLLALRTSVPVVLRETRSRVGFSSKDIKIVVGAICHSISVYVLFTFRFYFFHQNTWFAVVVIIAFFSLFVSFSFLFLTFFLLQILPHSLSATLNGVVFPLLRFPFRFIYAW